MLKISLLFKKIQTLRLNNSRILTIKNAKFSGYHFYINLNIYADFQICISVPLSIDKMTKCTDVLGMQTLTQNRWATCHDVITKEMAYRSSRPEVFHKKVALRNFAKFKGKHLCQSLFVNKVAGLATLLKKRLWHRCFAVNFAELLRTPFLTEHLRWLLLGFCFDSLWWIREWLHCIILTNKNADTTWPVFLFYLKFF